MLICEVKMTLSELIEDAEITKEDFSRYCRVSIKQIERWCDNNNAPEYAIKLADALIERIH